MNSPLPIFPALLISASLSVGAQSNAPSDDSKPAASHVPGQEYPRIDSQLRSTFRVRAPDVTHVAVSLGRPLTVGRESNPSILRLHETLDQTGIENADYESPGTAHEWQTWCRSLQEFACRLFRD